MAANVEKEADPARPPNAWWAAWAVVAAFGTYFCMYGFRKPYTAASFENAAFGGVDFKTILVSTQVFGYMLSKFIGIKVIAEMPSHRRASAILILIFCAEVSLVCFGLAPRPWNAAFLFLNGLSLGMVFGLVLGFLEGRRLTEALAAGLCTSFILADGVTKTIGSELLDRGVPEDWMPAAAGMVYLTPLCVFVAMLSRIPEPNDDDIVERSKRLTMTRQERWSLFSRYALGLSMLVVMYLLITIFRSIRSDFAPELWKGLGREAAPEIFTWSEMWVAIGVLAANGFAAYFRDNRNAFFFSLGTCVCGFLIVIASLVGRQAFNLAAFPFMVLIGLGLYLPYVAMHTTIFERMLAMTREKGNLGFLMYVADSYGYLGFVLVLVTRGLWTRDGGFLDLFIWFGWVTTAISLVCLALAWRYFANCRYPTAATVAKGAE